jgi:NADH-quinone oxidoreductase subunit D
MASTEFTSALRIDTGAQDWKGPTADDDLDSDDMILNMGPQHPSTHGVLRIELKTDGEVVKAARPHIGYLHRCYEKHAESVDYPGVNPYTDRMDYVASMGNSLGYALAVEKLMGIEVSPYVQTVRVIMAELQRIASHFVAVGTYGMDIGAFTPFLHLLRDREKILDLFEWTCGARLLYNYHWVGGVSHDLPEGFVKACRQFLREYDKITVPELMDLLIGYKIFI